MTQITRTLLASILLITVSLTACAIEPETEDAHAGMSSNADPAMIMAGHHHPMAPLEDMPENVRAADARTQEAYRFAVANPDAAHEVPCYCGCVALGHMSSYECYVAGTEPDGALVFDAHAVNCTVCVDITQDQMRLMDGGESWERIRTYIDEKYSVYGPPTNDG